MDTFACFENYMEEVAWGVQNLALPQTEVKKGRGKVLLNGKVLDKEQVRSWLWVPAWCLSWSWEVPGAGTAEELNGEDGLVGKLTLLTRSYVLLKGLHKIASYNVWKLKSVLAVLEYRCELPRSQVLRKCNRVLATP